MAAYEESIFILGVLGAGAFVSWLVARYATERARERERRARVVESHIERFAEARDFVAFAQSEAGLAWIRPRLWTYLVRTTRERPLAEEIAQESFVRLLASRGAALPEVERRAYLFRIAENLVRDTVRRRALEKTAALETVPEPSAPAPCDSAIEKWNHREIATTLGVGTASVRVLLHRARRRFQQVLQEGTRHEPCR